MQQLRQQIASTSLKHGKKSIILNDVAQLEPSDTVIDSERMLISIQVQVVWYVATAFWYLYMCSDIVMAYACSQMRS